MKIANVKGMVAKLMMVGLAAGALAIASPVKAQAQRFAVGVQLGNPDYRYYPNGYRYDRDDYRYRGDDLRAREQREEFRSREAREEFERRQAYVRHEQWERAHRYDNPYGYR
jgi:hypothetical protein